MRKIIKYAFFLMMSLGLLGAGYISTLSTLERHLLLARFYMSLEASPNISYLLTYPFIDHDYDRLIPCVLEGERFHIPKGYFTFGGSVLGCHAVGYKQIFLNAFLPDLLEIPGKKTWMMGYEKRQPLEVSIVITHDGKSWDNSAYFSKEKERRSKDFIQVSENVWEDLQGRREEYYLTKNRKIFYVKSTNERIHVLRCGDYINREGGKCSSGFRIGGISYHYNFNSDYFGKEDVDPVYNQIDGLIRRLHITREEMRSSSDDNLSN